MRTRWTLLFQAVLLLTAFMPRLSLLAQSIGNQDVPVVPVDGDNVDFVGSIPNVTVDKLTQDRIEKGILMPKFGTEDIFLVAGSKRVIDLTEYGLTCLTPFQGGIITSPEPARTGDQKPTARTIVSTGQLGTVQVIVQTDPSKVGNCDGSGELLKVLRITVTNADIFRALQELKALVGDVEGLEIGVVGDRVVLDGKIIVPSELNRLQTVVENFNVGKEAQAQITILPLYEMSPLAFQMLAEKMEEEIAGGPDRPRDITVRVLNGRFFLEGSVDEVSQRLKALKVCRAYLQDELTKTEFGIARPDKVDDGNDPAGIRMCNNSIWIRQGQPPEPEPVIAIRADFVTLNREYLKEFEFFWRPTLSANGTVNYESDVGRFTSGFIGTIRRLFPVLRTAAQHGYGRVLKSATVILVDKPAGSGEPPTASISETFQIPFQTTGPEGEATVQFSELSTSIQVQAATVPGSDKIQMKITANQSQNLGAGANGAPTVLNNNINTSLVVTNGVSAALGGMIGEARAVNYDRSPGSEGQGSANFELFGIGKAQRFSDAKSQFLVFITPEKMRNPSDGTEKLKRKFRLRRN